MKRLKPVFVFIIFAVLLGEIGRGRPNFVFVFGPKNDDFLFFGILFFSAENR